MTSGFSPTIRQLRAFKAVYQLRKLGAAAEQLSLTQSAVSVLIRQLEEGLGARLFDRTTRSLQPTQAGQDAIQVAERILRDVDTLGSSFMDLRAHQRGRVCIAITPTLAGMLLPEVIRTFSLRYPHVQTLVDDVSPEQFVSRVVGEHVDFGIGTPERAGGEIVQQPLMRDTLCLVCAVGHPLAQLKQVRWADLDGQPLITARPGYGVRQLVETSAARAGVRLNVVGEVSFQSTALWLARSGQAVALVPTAYARCLAQPDLLIKPLRQPVVSRDVYLVCKRGRSLSLACESFIQVLREELASGRAMPQVGKVAVPKAARTT
ncbi:LysR family transcriptional regulator [Hylemonella gracilis str. Niagara R]|uniref:LysR family transcriptional regulator n=1 Tax=Hylemonella gracilis str. Niagara R TaxID=1458275 RepID=A0A016XI89_9BURK|nr:LysR family transcriptional regulator [Hylemonella gracilis]EYC51287.1 LysR family transcriptional regulator [Hylemonella gracilis str. Niagara R]